jgi:phosphoribosylglycinamide formyltransferase-1
VGKSQETPLLNIGWFSTGRDEAARQLLQAVQDSIHRGDIHGKIVFVFSNRQPGESTESDLFFELVHTYGLPLVCLSSRKFKASLEQTEGWRVKYDREASRRIQGFALDICFFAGFMLIIGGELCQEYDIINLHPAVPGGPTGTWQEVIWKLIRDRALEAGAMIHLVTSELDRGPVVSYCSFPINGDPFLQYWDDIDPQALFQLIRQHELAREFPLIVLTLRALSRGEISIKGRKVVDARGRSIDGRNLTVAVDKAVESRLRSLSPDV